MNRRYLVSIVWIVLGAVLFGCGIAEVVDEFWSGVGGGFLGVGIFQIVRIVRYRKDETYREAVDTAKTDERNRFLANKAWAWAGYLYVIVGAVGTFVFRLLEMKMLSIFCGGSISLILVLYWGSYLWLRRKY